LFFKFNNITKILLILVLTLPTTVLADEITEVETFEGGDGEQVTDIVVPPTENNNLVVIENTWEAYGGMDNYHMSLEHSKHGGTSNDYEFVLPTDHDVYEVGFTIGAMNNQGQVQYTHSDDTTQTSTLDAQNGMAIAEMYEDVVYSVKSTANKFIDKFVITINDWSLLDNVEIKYAGTTTTTLDPLTIQRNANFASYGILETNEEKGIRIVEEEIIYQEQVAIAIQEEIQEGDNMAETGYKETDEERAIREELTNVVIFIGDEEVVYNEKEQSDGTIDRDQERFINEELYGIALTNEQIERGDLELYDYEIIEKDIYEEEEQLINDDGLLVIEYIELEAKELEDEYILMVESTELIKELKLEGDELQEFIDTMQIIEQIDLEIYEVEIFEEEIIVDEIDWIEIRTENDLFPPTEEEIQKDIEKFNEENNEEINNDDRTDEMEDVLADRQDGFFEDEERTVELSKEEIEIEVEILQEVIEEIIKVEEIIEIKEQEEIDTLTEKELEVYEEEVEAAIVEFVQELDTTEQVEVLEQVAEVSVQNLAVADEQTKQVVQAVVNEVTSVATVAELTEEELEVVAEVLGVTETEDIKIIAEQAVKDENIAIAVTEYVERATENADVEDYSISNVIVEVQIEEFLADPIGQLLNIDISDIVLSDIGNDMPQKSKDNAKKTVVPLILVGQIITAPFTKRF
jgi:hypothetical protein